jgi:hypothetical protein
MQSKNRILFSFLIFLASFSLQTQSVANEKPVVENFYAFPTEVDLAGSNLSINFELKVSHIYGIADTSVLLSLTNSLGNSVSASLNRLNDSNLDNKTSATFKGIIVIPRNFPQGIYTYSIDDGVTSNLKNGFRIGTQKISNPIIRSTKGLESGIIVTKNGYLDLNYSTFNGPAFGSQLGKSYDDSSKYSALPVPLWKVGESVPVKNYYEVVGSQVILEISSLTPKICTFSNNSLNLISEGNCQIVAFTPRTENYISKQIVTSMSIGPSRAKQELTIELISPFSARNLPMTLELPVVRGYGYSLFEYVYPESITPSICTNAGYTLRILNGGLCQLTYQAKGDNNYLPSEVYTQNVLVEKIYQTISFTLPVTANLSVKTIALSATASSGGVITYQTTSTGICSITGSTLNLLQGGNCAITATQAGTTTLAPISATATVVITGSTTPAKKTITCVKGNKTKKVSGTNPKCPKGYKVKR